MASVVVSLPVVALPLSVVAVVVPAVVLVPARVGVVEVIPPVSG